MTTFTRVAKLSLNVVMKKFNRNIPTPTLQKSILGKNMENIPVWQPWNTSFAMSDEDKATDRPFIGKT